MFVQFENGRKLAGIFGKVFADSATNSSEVF